MKEGVYAINDSKELGDILAFLVRAPKELPGFPFASKSVDLERAAKALLTCYLEGQIFIFKTKLNKIVGVLALQQRFMWWTQESILCDLTFFVDGTCEIQGIGEKLLLAAVQYAKIKEKDLLISVLSEEKLPALQKYYKKLGFTPSGVSFLNKKE